jgi:hypothetical protein
MFVLPALLSAEVSLRINGDVVAAPGDVRSFSYSPGNAKIEVVTFFKDVRCFFPDSPPAEALSLRLDQLRFDDDNPVLNLEPEGAYPIPLDGAVTYRATTPDDPPELGNYVIDITTSGITNTQDADCTHELDAVGSIDPITGLPSKGALRVSGFEQPFTIEFQPPASGVGFDVVITNNTSLFTSVYTDVLLGLAPSDAANVSVTSGAYATDTATWTIPILWPEQQETLSVRFEDLEAGTSYSVEVVSVDATNRDINEEFPSEPQPPFQLPPELLTVVNTSTQATTP